MASPSVALHGQLPRHIAIIMDGNGRWAKSRGLARLEGHRAGAKSVRLVVEECRRLGVRYLTLFSFSTENWQRQEDEVGGLMKLFRRYLDSELHALQSNGVRLRTIGDLSRLPRGVREALERDVRGTESNEGLDLILAISYGGRQEITEVARSLACQVQAGELNPSEINEELVARNLWTANIPDPDLLIRTSGEMRISNFLLWQLAYSEIVVTQTQWPDFDAAELRECLEIYAGRERRFGLTAEQVRKTNALNASAAGESTCSQSEL